MSESFSKERIAKNSILLYVRMLFTMWLNLYATRLVLQNLGVEDMGVYGVVGSITTLFTVFVSGITSAVQRYLTFELGLKDGKPNMVFCTSLNVIFILSAILLVLLEVGGLWVLYNKVNIPEDRMGAAFWVYQLSILTCLVNIIAIPYNSLVIAHEKMNAFAAISILQTVLSCATAYSLSLFSEGRLVIYALLSAVVSISIRLIYQVYCHAKFDESHYHFIINRDILRSMARFMGVNTISSILQLIAHQGIVFVINWTFGVALNAVYNIAQQLRNMVLSFALNINRAISPQITKTYAAGDMSHHLKLVYGGSKLQIYMICFVMIPFLFRTDYLMHLWLGQVPAHAAFFAQCSVFASLAYAMLEPIRASVYATNRITKFNLIPDSFYVLVLPISYGVSILTRSPEWMMASLVVVEIVAVLLRVWYATRVGLLSLKTLATETFIPCAAVAFISGMICYVLNRMLEQSLTGMLEMLVINSILLCLAIYIVGINRQERQIVNRIINCKRRMNCKNHYWGG